MADFTNINPDDLKKALQGHMDSLETFEDKMNFALQLHSWRKTDDTGELNARPGLGDAIKEVEQSLFYHELPDGGLDEEYMQQSVHDFNKNMIGMQVKSSRMLKNEKNSISFDDYYKMQDLFEIYEDFRDSMHKRDVIVRVREDDYIKQINALSDEDIDDYRHYYLNRDEGMKQVNITDTAGIDNDSRLVDADKVYEFIKTDLIADIKASPEPVAAEDPIAAEEKKLNGYLDDLQGYSRRLNDLTASAKSMLSEYNRMKAAKSDNSDEFKALGEALKAVAELNCDSSAQEINDIFMDLKDAAEDYNKRIDSSMFRGVLSAGRARRELSGRLLTFADEGAGGLNAIYPKDLLNTIPVKEQTERTFNHLIELGPETEVKENKTFNAEADVKAAEKTEAEKKESEKKGPERDPEKSRKIDLPVPDIVFPLVKSNCVILL